MKKTFIVIVTTSLFVLPGCKKSSTSSTSSSYNMTATVNGGAFSGSNCFASSAGGGAVIEAYSGTSSSSSALPVIQLTLGNYSKTVGSFNIDGSTNRAFIDSTSISGDIAASGTINITSVSPNIVGTFSFTCTNGIKITDGSFIAQNY